MILKKQVATLNAKLHPTRVRGLKYHNSVTLDGFSLIAPHTGARIKIVKKIDLSNPPANRTPHGCAD